MDMDDAFNRLLERIEELVAENTRTDVMYADERSKRTALEAENTRLKGNQVDYQKLRDFVGSTPERNADWLSFITPKPKSADDEMPF
jgi:FtsZ-binding cell division protein ZapB